ncbi:MAG: hypothetical protein A3B10_04440 [Candidatus Doudnabacteria bacterium RIFCSPLOWO2_01_FULL_44_21]|uniref:Reverse transcriptase domain-containing protein n=1 Tax=Candidatus Doudnabacteria bacterium RIFCSPLOWO2_01_FULL_44_21 TaxID=1817841 RepID=A0A1F5PXT8_9BACT|nr:MAG: hypothetical protein A3B95_01405 [Candidatus Doudnabacteria bacterium RIFCSPHIGHO2_02_FULL_43_13b]OGE94729.1 MAG: hypothetical protein A3B10_04440 [Candidatus Doudnabacteria bacterium RIFCSPLOWO2_01_FULL_44_21]
MVSKFVGGGLLAYKNIISVENLFLAWQEFIRGKRGKLDVQKFGRNLIDNILQLHNDLANKTYQHGGYHQFNISDPKPRNISKASVRDRLVHHAVYRILYPFFDKQFIYDSYSCRISKGTHKAIKRLHSMFLEASDYNRKTCWVLKLDIRQFFASIDHEVLKQILKEYIPDQDIMRLLDNIIDSFGTDCFVGGQVGRKEGLRSNLNLRETFAKGSTFRSGLRPPRKCARGLPLGNLTSQLLVNIYLNEFDQFVKHKLKAKYYIRYADDFVILGPDKKINTMILSRIVVFLNNELNLSLHPNKVIIKTFSSGVDFLGWVNFPQHRTLRTSTKRRMMKRIKIRPNDDSLQSYLGLLKHGQTKQIKQELLSNYWLFKNSDIL